ncbi:hypothetical protein [Bdellovibrio sp. HCB274]|uniref:hypothetical protein n=1 Tax=Bdellovibrio sp. HCB274 TaxID=3394361 RepID=UPI0039B4F873
MTKLNVKKCALSAVLSIGFLTPQLPHQVFANTAPSSFPIDLFDIGDSNSTTTTNDQKGNSNSISNGNQGGKGNQGSTTRPRPQTQNGNQGNQGGNQGSNKPNSSSQNSMKAVKVPAEFSCNLFESTSTAALNQALTDMTNEIRSKGQCTTDGSADRLQKDTESIRKNVSTLQKMMNSKSVAEVDYQQLSNAMTDTMTATTSIGDMLSNNSFLNSTCGRDSMQSGKALLAFNQLIDGLAPMALFAVSLNPTLAPALPFVIGGAVATKGITALTQMFQQEQIDMTKKDNRLAVFQNTCQYIKIVKKVRFLQLTADRNFTEFNTSLQNEFPLYKASLANKIPTSEFSTNVQSKYEKVKKQYILDMSNFRNFEISFNREAAEDDEMAICSFGQTAIRQIKQNQQKLKEGEQNPNFTKSVFPDSVFQNLKAALSLDTTRQIQPVNADARINTVEYYKNEIEKSSIRNTSDIRICAQNTKSWFNNIKKTLAEIDQIVTEGPRDASNGGGVVIGKTEQDKAIEEGATFRRVKRALEEIAKDDSVINRSNFSQDVADLKAGLFGGRNNKNPPVLSWIDHTMSVYDISISNFQKGIKNLQMMAMVVTESGSKIRKHISQVTEKDMMFDAIKYRDDKKIADALSNLIPSNKYIDADRKEAICSTLRTTYFYAIDARDHLSTVQIMCDMISGVIDTSMDGKIIKVCKGDLLIRGTTPILQKTQKDLASFEAQALKVQDRLKQLRCPVYQ